MITKNTRIKDLALEGYELDSIIQEPIFNSPDLSSYVIEIGFTKKQINPTEEAAKLGYKIGDRLFNINKKYEGIITKFKIGILELRIYWNDLYNVEQSGVLFSYNRKGLNGS
jgi:hypothetical protein